PEAQPFLASQAGSSAFLYKFVRRRNYSPTTRKVLAGAPQDPASDPWPCRRDIPSGSREMLPRQDGAPAGEECFPAVAQPARPGRPDERPPRPFPLPRGGVVASGRNENTLRRAGPAGRG